MKIGYARVLTVEQNLDRQLKALTEFGCEKIYQEKITGMKVDRPQLQLMLSELNPEDVVVVKELTRVSRSTADMLNLVKQITDKGCFIKSLNEAWLDTSSPSGKLMLTLMVGISQLERGMILERCSEGRKIAMARGVRMGRPKLNGDQMKHAIDLYKAKEMSVRNICSVCGISKTTFGRRLKELGLTNGGLQKSAAVEEPKWAYENTEEWIINEKKSTSIVKANRPSDEALIGLSEILHKQREA